jgi:hypothetical protein
LAKRRDEDDKLTKPTMMRVRVLKCRETGDTGPADLLDYNRATGRIELVEAQCPFDIADDGGSKDF